MVLINSPFRPLLSVQIFWGRGKKRVINYWTPSCRNSCSLALNINEYIERKIYMFIYVFSVWLEAIFNQLFELFLKLHCYIIVIVRAVYLSQEVEDVISRFEGK